MKFQKISAALAAAVIIASVMAGCSGAPKDNTVKVSTVDDFLAAIAPDATIELAPGTYDLSAASDYGTAMSGKNYTWEECYDGFQLVIKNINGLTIKTASDDPKATVICAIPRYANVVYMRSCGNVTFSGFTAGHTEEPGSCSGGVFAFQNCHGVNIDKCRMYGCGILGIECSQCSSVKTTGSEIYDCSYGGASFFETDVIEFTDCDIHDIDGAAIWFTECSEITWNGTAVENGFYNLDSDKSLALIAE